MSVGSGAGVGVPSTRLMRLPRTPSSSTASGLRSYTRTSSTRACKRRRGSTNSATTSCPTPGTGGHGLEATSSVLDSFRLGLVDEERERYRLAGADAADAMQQVLTG